MKYTWIKGALPCLLMLLIAARPASATDWTEGRHYFRIDSATAAAADSNAGKVAVTEVFSYGCPACNAFQPFMLELKRRMPASVVLNYVPAAWIASEDWPLFQRAYLAAESLGVAERAHDAMFDAIWRTHELSSDLHPNIARVARFYDRITGVPAEKFIEVANSFAVEVAIKRADEQVKQFQAERTPTLIVNGRYRIDPVSAGGAEQMVALTLWLVNRELGR
jgi:thiol:disulfide interchange protein DsbA